MTTSPTTSVPRRAARARAHAQHVAIVGGGFAGAAFAYHLLRASRGSGPRLSIVEPGQLGRGVAYAATNRALRLNVPAARMSIDPEAPHDFVDYAGASPHAFLPRALYGDYVSERLQRARERVPGASQIYRAQVVGLKFSGEPRSHSTLTLSDGRTLQADRVVLATGVCARNDARLPHDPRVLDAWDEAAIQHIDTKGTVLLLGSGLSALDALALLDASGHRGKKLLVSRHGLLPRPHATRAATFEIPVRLGAPPSSVLGLIAYCRELVAEAEEAGASWQHALDALRPHTQRVWQSLTTRERTRFLRHVRSYWEVLRHRAPIDCIEHIDTLQARGELERFAGRMVRCRPCADALEVELRPRGPRGCSPRHERVAAVIRCLGPSADIADSSPLTAALLHQGLVQACATQLGIVTAEQGRVVDRRGQPNDRLFALGIMCRASRWETTAAPDIVRDARELAHALTEM